MQSISFGQTWSWDGGASFPEGSASTLAGSPNGEWPGAKGNTMMPFAGFSAPGDARLGGSPNAFRPYVTVQGGPITFGLTVQETTLVSSGGGGNNPPPLPPPLSSAAGCCLAAEPCFWWPLG
jgi:hypothetical protein